MLERDTGLQAASYLQEAGFAGGEELHSEFAEWLLATCGVERPADLDSQFLSEVISQFFSELGWGALTVTPLGDSVLALDSGEWAEASEDARGEFPSCHLTCGLLADFFGRLSEGLVAVMEVECRSMGAERCRFLVGATDVMQRVYDAMGEGVTYDEAVSAGT